MKRVADQIAPFAKKLAADLTTAIHEHVDGLLERARAYALEQLRRDLDASTSPAERERRFAELVATPVVEVAKSVAPKPRKVKALPPPARSAGRLSAIAKSAKKSRARMRCSKCGALGFRSDGCGRTHNTASNPDNHGDDEDPEGAVHALAITDPPAIIEPVARFESPLPRSIVDEVDDDDDQLDDVDGGGYMPAPLAPRELIELSPTDHREVCPAHGWVGRLAFQRDHHDACVLAALELGEECRRCKGTGRVTSKFCTLCDGTGVRRGSVVEDDSDLDADDDEPEVVDESPRVVLRIPGERRRLRNPEVSRSSTLARKDITREVLRSAHEELLPFTRTHEYAELVALRPRTRGDCLDGPRPCAFVGCDHHLYLDVNPETGAIKLNFPDREVHELAVSCALDVADGGSVTLEQTGEMMNLTRERVRQVEVRALHNLKAGLAAITPEDER